MEKKKIKKKKKKKKKLEMLSVENKPPAFNNLISKETLHVYIFVDPMTLVLKADLDYLMDFKWLVVLQQVI